MTIEISPRPDGVDAPPPRPRRVMRRVSVTRVEQLSPRMVRVTFTGDDLLRLPGTGRPPTSNSSFLKEARLRPACRSRMLQELVHADKLHQIGVTCETYD